MELLCNIKNILKKLKFSKKKISKNIFETFLKHQFVFIHDIYKKIY